MKTSKQWSSTLVGRKCHAVAVLLFMGFVGSTELAAQSLSPISESPGQAESQILNAEYVAAQDQYDQNHWHDAFSSFARLAEKHHPQSARAAFQMWKYGPVLYRTDFAVTKDQVLLWCLLSSSMTVSEADTLRSMRQCGAR